MHKACKAYVYQAYANNSCNVLTYAIHVCTRHVYTRHVRHLFRHIRLTYTTSSGGGATRGGGQNSEGGGEGGKEGETARERHSESEKT